MSNENQSHWEEALSPSKEAQMKAELAAPGHMPALEESAQLEARKAMNALKTISQAVFVALEQETNQSECFQAMLDRSKSLASRFLVRSGVNPEDRNNRWLINVAEKTMMPFARPGGEISEDLLEKMTQAAHERGHEYPKDQVWQKDPMISLALMRGLGLLHRAQSDFDFGRKNKVEDLEMLRDLVLQNCASALSEICPELTPSGERVTFFVMLLDQAFELLDASWRKNSIKAHQALAGITKDQLRSWRLANPQGFSLDPVVQQFEQSLNRLLRLTMAARKADRAKK